jgi:hypothetical protein
LIQELANGIGKYFADETITQMQNTPCPHFFDIKAFGQLPNDSFDHSSLWLFSFLKLLSQHQRDGIRRRASIYPIKVEHRVSVIKPLSALLTNRLCRTARPPLNCGKIHTCYST